MAPNFITTMVYLLFLVLALPILLVIILSRSFLATSASSSEPPPLPPGPKPWPIIGNLPHLTQKPHVSLHHFSQLYGPLISLRLGSQLLVVASSPTAAAQILKTHDRLLSARYVPKAAPYKIAEMNRKSIIWASSCNDQWKAFRAMFRTQMFSAKAIESQAAVREKKVAEMVEFLGRGKSGEAVSIGEVVFATIFDSLSNLIFSRDCIGLEATSTASKLKSLIRRMMELGGSPNVSDFFPIMEKLDPQGIRRESFRCVKELYSVWAPYVKQRRERRLVVLEQAADAKDFLDVFLQNGLDNDQIDWLSLELFVAGTDTNTATIEWAMAELMRNKGAMNMLREELNRELSTTTPLKESDVSRLPYLSAIVKEIMRLHPPAPLLVPHQAPETCEVMNYMIPKGARVAINVWAIGRDPIVWGDDPLSFKPERFVGSKVDFRGQDFELLPFGAGRRMCPGVPLAARQIPLVLAALVRTFDWCLPHGEDPAELNMNEKFGITLQKEQPLLLVPNTSSCDNFHVED